jgi:FPC/CPF motif-containing protein YcgG
MTERRFESSMWSQLWRLHKLDVIAGNLPADDVSNDTDSPQFSLSMAGHPFFLIGLHPHASRLARRFSHPVMVFNSHRQFEKLKNDGRFEKMQTATRTRDIELQGSMNPNLADFGDASEARQYSGRKVEDGQQVSDLVAFGPPDCNEYLSSGRSLDYASRVWLTTDDVLYSDRSRPMFTILEDTCGRRCLWWW